MNCPPQCTCQLNLGHSPKKSRAFMVYFYKTFAGKTEIRLFLKTQNKKTRRWEFSKKGEIHKSGKSAVERIAKLFNSWE